MHQKNQIPVPLENLEIDIERLRSMGVSTAAGRFFTGVWLEFEKAKNREKCGRPKTLEAERYIADQLNIAPVSVRKYAQYTRALETIRKRDPGLVAQLLSGKRSLSVQKVIGMAEAEKEKKTLSIRRSEKSSKIIQAGPNSKRRFSVHDSGGPIPSIKDMPAYDPDAELTGLALTVSSWMGSIQRVRSKKDWNRTSDAARADVFVSLSRLREQIEDTLHIIEENECRGLR